MDLAAIKRQERNLFMKKIEMRLRREGKSDYAAKRIAFSIMKDLKGRKDKDLTPEEFDLLEEEHPEDFEDYANKQFRHDFEEEIHDENYRTGMLDRPYFDFKVPVKPWYVYPHEDDTLRRENNPPDYYGLKQSRLKKNRNMMTGLRNREIHGPRPPSNTQD